MRETSLYKTIKPGENFNLLNILETELEEFPTCSEDAKVKIPQARRSIEIDQDVVNAMRAKYGNMPLGKALRIMLGLKPKIAQNAWQEEEDYLIKEHYPTKGSPPLAEVLGRSVDCIRDRASFLGIKRVWLYKRDLRHKNPARREKARLKREEANKHQ